MHAPQYVKSVGMIGALYLGGIKDKAVGFKHGSNEFVAIFFLFFILWVIELPLRNMKEDKRKYKKTSQTKEPANSTKKDSNPKG